MSLTDPATSKCCEPILTTSSGAMTLSPNAAAISSSVFCLVSLKHSKCQTVSHIIAILLSFCRSDSREVEIGNGQEEAGTHHEDVVVVFVDVGKRTWAGFGDCRQSIRKPFDLVGIYEISPATLTMKWDAAAKPITLLRRAIGRTSAPYSQVVLLSIPSADRHIR